MKGNSMSEDFIQFTFPCKDCVVAAICKEKPKNAKELILEHGHAVRCLTIPKFDDPLKSYHKGLLECWANIGHDILYTLEKQTSENLKTEKRNKIPRDFLYFMTHVSDILQWMVNSYSWKSGRSEDFDIKEINMKLKSLSFMK